MVLGSIFIYVKYQMINLRFKTDTGVDDFDRKQFLFIAGLVTTLIGFFIAKY